MDTSQQIEDVRVRINQTDQQLLQILSQRAAHVLAIGQIKSAAGMAVYDPNRERKILERIRELNPGPLSDEAIARLFERIIDESRALERHVTEQGQER